MKKRKKKKRRSKKLTALDLAKIWLIIQILDKMLDVIKKLSDYYSNQ